MTMAISLEQISKRYPGIKALDEVSFAVKQGSIHGFLGPNGAGKTTTMKIMMGLLSPCSGRMEYFGSLQRPAIGYLPEIPPLYPTMRVKDYLSFIGQINGSNNGFLIDQAIDRCGLRVVGARVIGNLSKGYRQRVGIAQALVYDAPLIILDEPMAGLDPASICEIRNLIKELSGERTILFSSHQLHEVNLVCDDVTIINHGKIVESGPLESLGRKFQSNQVLEIQLERWNGDLESDLKTQFSCESVLKTEENEKVFLRIFLSGGEDLRADVSRFCVERGCGLLGLSEQKIDLEEIFALSMKEELS